MEIGGKTETSIMAFLNKAYNVVLRTLACPGSQGSHNVEAKAGQFCRMKHHRAFGYLPKHYYVSL